MAESDLFNSNARFLLSGDDWKIIRPASVGSVRPMVLPRASLTLILVTCGRRLAERLTLAVVRCTARLALPINRAACRYVDWVIRRRADALTAACVAEDWPRARDIEEAMGADETFLVQLRIDGERLRRDAGIAT